MVKRENWRGKYYWVLRDTKGRIVTYKRVQGERKAQIEQRLQRQRKTNRDAIPTLRKNVVLKQRVGDSRKEPSKQVFQYVTEKRTFNRNTTQVQVRADVYIRSSPNTAFRLVGTEEGYSLKGATNKEGIEQAKAMIISKTVEKYDLGRFIQYRGLIDLRNIQVRYTSYRLE